MTRMSFTLFLKLIKQYDIKKYTTLHSHKVNYPIEKNVCHLLFLNIFYLNKLKDQI